MLNMPNIFVSSAPNHPLAIVFLNFRIILQLMRILVVSLSDRKLQKIKFQERDFPLKYAMIK